MDRDALAILDVIDGIVDDTHPEGDGCPLCVALDDLRAALDNPSGVNCDCGREHHIVMYRDRSDPAVGLREAAQAAVNTLKARGGYGYVDALRGLEDALAATPTASPTAGGLDVERLDTRLFAEAYSNCVRGYIPADDFWPCVVREYAALQSEATEPAPPRDPPDLSPELDAALPSRVVVDAHGHYWRDYGTFWSMCPVSDENHSTAPVAIYVRAKWSEAIREAATPTASPTDPTHVHEWEAWDSTDPNESWFACVSGCSSIVRRRLASPTATDRHKFKPGGYEDDNLCWDCGEPLRNIKHAVRAASPTATGERE